MRPTTVFLAAVVWTVPFTGQPVRNCFTGELTGRMNRPQSYFICSEHVLRRKRGQKGCSRHHVRTDDLETLILETLRQALAGVTVGDPDSVSGKLDGILHNPVLFGVDLADVGLAGKVEAFLREELAGPGAVRGTLQKYLAPQA